MSWIDMSDKTYDAFCDDIRLDKLVAKLRYGPRYEAVCGEDEEWDWWCKVTDEAAKEIQYLREQLCSKANQ